MVEVSQYMQVSSSLHYSQGDIYGSSIRYTEYLPKGVIIRATIRPSRKCELMKLSVPLVSSIYADAAFTIAAPKYWNSLPDELRTLSYFIIFKYRIYSYMLSLYFLVFKFIIIRVIIYLFYYFNLTHINR